MAKYVTSNTLIESVKRRASIPASQNTFSEADFLAFANEEMDLGIVPHVLSFHQEYFVRTDLVPLESGEVRYSMPPRAVGDRLRELAYQDSGGNIFEMTRITVDDVPNFRTSYAGNLTMFYIEGSDIVILSDMPASVNGFLRFSYYLRPNELVSESRVGIITNINTVSGEIAVDKIPDNITLNDKLDIVQTKAPHKTLALDITALGINSNTKTFTFDPAQLPKGLAVGDHIALAEETIVPQVPTDLHSMLSQRIAARCLESLGDTAGLGAANTKLQEMEVKTGNLISDRVEGASLKVVNKTSVLRRNRSWRF